MWLTPAGIEVSSKEPAAEILHPWGMAETMPTRPARAVSALLSFILSVDVELMIDLWQHPESVDSIGAYLTN
jgi:hypothetical protein